MFSGLTLNLDQCELLAIKSCSASSLYDIPVKSHACYLGITICKDDNIRGRLNFDPVVVKAKKRCNSLRDLSLRGRAPK